MTEKIDFVVTYLDSTDEDWIKQKAQYSGESIEKALNSEARFRNMDNFQYWFRAVEKYAPWVNKIHLVTWGHVPDWLDTNHPKLNVVRHDEFIPNELLPTFNSRTIELNFDKIDSLSEFFVNFNDDMFLNAEVKSEDFIKNGLPVLQYLTMPIPADSKYNIVQFNNNYSVNKAIRDKKFITRKKLSLKNGFFAFLINLWLLPVQLYTKRYVGFFQDHLAQPMLKSSFKELRKVVSDEFDNASRSKFRSPNTINIWTVLDYQRAEDKFYPHNSFKFGKVVPLENNKKYEEILNSKYKLICFNDGSAEINFTNERDHLLEALDKKFPEKSSFEL
ncbi:glycosyl transferase [Lactococcus taiwanensis]|uniref:Glycosyl transferase n=1 Tax=Lactococcus taiwanensis TaxID=1151742 RepID=A0AA45KGS1_9LACT|nr:glycosyl transferase [Lactococcus taiwanensis]KZK38146.1 Glycosyltransferase [Lactococcus cremoris]QSE77063.1 glycosyl transferase [Lactococcus taiwanensis]